MQHMDGETFITMCQNTSRHQQLIQRINRTYEQQPNVLNDILSYLNQSINPLESSCRLANLDSIIQTNVFIVILATHQCWSRFQLTRLLEHFCNDMNQVKSRLARLALFKLLRLTNNLHSCTKPDRVASTSNSQTDQSAKLLTLPHHLSELFAGRRLVLTQSSSVHRVVQSTSISHPKLHTYLHIDDNHTTPIVHYVCQDWQIQENTKQPSFDESLPLFDFDSRSIVDEQSSSPGAKSDDAPLVPEVVDVVNKDLVLQGARALYDQIVQLEKETNRLIAILGDTVTRNEIVQITEVRGLHDAIKWLNNLNSVTFEAVLNEIPSIELSPAVTFVFVKLSLDETLSQHRAISLLRFSLLPAILAHSAIPRLLISCIVYAIQFHMNAFTHCVVERLVTETGYLTDPVKPSHLALIREFSQHSPQHRNVTVPVLQACIKSCETRATKSILMNESECQLINAMLMWHLSSMLSSDDQLIVQLITAFCTNFLSNFLSNSSAIRVLSSGYATNVVHIIRTLVDRYPNQARLTRSHLMQLCDIVKHIMTKKLKAKLEKMVE